MLEIANREELLSKLIYQKMDVDLRKKFNSINEFVLSQIYIIKEYFEDKQVISNDEYIFCNRAQFCIDEFNSLISKGLYEECYYDLYEVIESDKNNVYDNLVQKQSGYIYSPFISSKELTVIKVMIEQLEEKIKIVI